MCHQCIVAHAFATISGCEQLILGATHRSGNCFYLQLKDSLGVIPARVGSPVGASDHCFVSAVIKVKQRFLDISFTCNVFFKSRVDWNGIYEGLSSLDWLLYIGRIMLGNPLNNHLTSVIEKSIPSWTLHLFIKEKSWFNDSFRHTYHLKHEAYNLRRQNQSDFTWRNYMVCHTWTWSTSYRCSIWRSLQWWY